MENNTRPSIYTVLISLSISVLIAGAGVYTLVEKKIIISGKYSGDLYLLSDSESIAIAVSMFMVSGFFVLFLFQKTSIKRIAEWLLGLGVILFLFSSFL